LSSSGHLTALVGKVLPLLLPLLILCVLLTILGVYLVIRSVIRIRQYDRMIVDLKLQHARLAPFH